MRKSVTTAGKAVDAERDEKLQALREACQLAGLPLECFAVPDCTCDTVQLDAGFFLTLVHVVGCARSVSAQSDISAALDGDADLCACVEAVDHRLRVAAPAQKD